MQINNIEHKVAQTVDDINMIRESIANLNAISCDIKDRRAQLNIQSQLREWHTKIMRLEYNLFVIRAMSKQSTKG